MRPKVRVFIATSLDGFIAREDGGIDWLPTTAPEGEDYGYSSFMEQTDVLVMGRNTFELVLTFDGYPYGRTPLIVLSSQLTEADIPENLRELVSVRRESPAELLDYLAGRGVGSVYLDGGKVIQSYLRAGLVDELTITRIPVLLGAGIPLFGELAKDVHLEHLSTQTYSTGLVQSKYAVKASADS